MLGRMQDEPHLQQPPLRLDFPVADVQFPIISVDFLGHFRLLVDIAAGRLVDTACSQSFPIISE
jgi:hypothetical protein